jgi:hypothetical protein
VPPAASAKPRRTQQERRDGTVRKLLDAAAESLIELGYANTSVQEICKRAGVSHGGLFRHFSSRVELMIRVATTSATACWSCTAAISSACASPRRTSWCWRSSCCAPTPSRACTRPGSSC